jgi:tetratricopeptide (TPR) repeat protein
MLKLFTLAALLLVITAGLVAQSTPEIEKGKEVRRAKMIEQVVTEVPQLRLPENRAIVFAKIGAVISKNDPERGRSFFRNAIAELIAAQDFAEQNKRLNGQMHDLLNGQSLRPQVLNLIASHDAELALESLYKTRPAAIERAMGNAAASGKIGNYPGNSTYLAQGEINLEQRLIGMVAQQRPERAIALLKESINKKLSGETLNLLKKVFEKEPSTANELANEVVGKIVSKGFMTGTQPNYEYISLANGILGEFVRERNPDEKHIAFEESRMSSLANKLIGTYLSNGPQIGYIPLQQLEPIAKRFSPASYEQLKKTSAATRHRGHFIDSDPEISKLIQSNPAAEVLITEAKKFPVESRQSLYQTAANKLSEAGQYDRALALLNESFEDDALENAVSSLNWYYSQHLINKGDYTGAEEMILEFNESNRNSALISLAHTIYNKNPEENRTQAVGILNRVRSILPNKPETSNDMSQMLQLISTMTVIDPTEAFRDFEPVFDQINQLAEAFAVVNAFQGGSVRQGEFLIANGFSFGVYMDPSIFRTLADKDFSRTMNLIDGFSRREMRLMLRMQMLESGF